MVQNDLLGLFIEYTNGFIFVLNTEINLPENKQAERLVFKQSFDRLSAVSIISQGNALT